MAGQEGDSPLALPDLLIGARLQKYEVRKLIGAGGMGRVYEAWNPSIGKRVAIKVLADRAAQHVDATARFQREARAAGAVESPFIVDIFDAGQTDDGRPFIVMELLRGEPLSSVLAAHGKIEPSEVVRIATQVLRGLECAHETGIVHRDLKPDNIFLVDADPDPPLAKILDFGVSKFGRVGGEMTLTREGAVLGTPAYMSPEQAQGDVDVDARSDLWSLGAVIYQCLTGRVPFAGSTYEQIIVRICSAEPIALRTLAPDCPEFLASAVDRCLKKDPDQRFASARDLLTAFGQPSAGAARSRGVPATRTRDTTTVGSASAVRAEGPKLGGRRQWVGGTRLALVAAMVLLALSLFSTQAPPHPSATSPAVFAPAASAGAASEEADVSATALAAPALVPSLSAPINGTVSTSASPFPSLAASRPRASPSIGHARIAATASHTGGPGPAPPSATPKGVAGGLVIQPR